MTGLKSPKVNKEQEKAIKHGDGPLLIIAGAGTGKTTVVTERIKYLILSKKAKPSEILALTFTEKAAREMEERVDIGMPYGYSQMWIMTFHSFCDKILRREGLHIGLNPSYKLLTDGESARFFRKKLFDFDIDYFRPLGNPTKFIDAILQHFSRLTDEDISPEVYSLWTDKLKNETEEEKLEYKKYKELSSLYKTYTDLKIKEGYFEFGDLITQCLKLFRNRPNILGEYKRQFKYILVDEFQDTNYSQNEIVKLLAGENGNITVVADDDQSIYRFRGAAVSNVIQFRNSFPKTNVVVLTKNYRSTQEILDSSYKLIQFNNPDRLEVVEKIDKKLKSQLVETGDVPEFIHADRVENEAESVAKKVEELVESEGYSYKDFAVLVRANTHADPFVKSFNRNGIPSQFLGPGRLFKQPEVLDLIAYLKVLYNPEDSISLYRVLAIDYFEIAGNDLVSLSNAARKTNQSLYDVAVKVESEDISEKSKASIQKLIKIIKKHQNLGKIETAGRILYLFLEESGMLTYLLRSETETAEKKSINIAKFFDKLKSFESANDTASVSEVVDFLDLSLETGESPLAADSDWTENDAVNILTVHSSKGLEFPVVFIVNLVAQRFPTTDRREAIPIPQELIREILPVGDYHIEEERRLFYVGITRAKKRLYLTASDFYGDGKRAKKLSPFVYEALELDTFDKKLNKNKNEQLTFLEYKPKDVEQSLKSEHYKVTYLSYSDIETFETCPLHYKLSKIFRLPAPPSASASFGVSVHASLREFFESVTTGKKPTEKIMFDILEKNWVSKGFIDKKQERDFFEKGRMYLSGFLRQGFVKQKLPVLMEEKFSFPLKNAKGERILVGGTIDRVDDLGDGNIEIIDYKTSANIPSQKEVDKNMQLSFYALAATLSGNKYFIKSPDQIKLSLYYLDTQEKFTTTRTKKQLEDTIEKIFETKDAIEASSFKCSGHMFCKNGCEFSMFCKEDAEV